MPDQPQIPVGLATVLTGLVGAAFYAATAVQVVLDGDHSQGAIQTAVLGTAALITLAAGRFAQAYAWYKSQRLR